jgi:hypothetical protein
LHFITSGGKINTTKATTTTEDKQMTKLNGIISEAKEHFIANGRTETYVVQNDNGTYYCDAISLRELNIRDAQNGLNPKVLGCWTNDTFLGVKADMGYSYKSMK